MGHKDKEIIMQTFYENPSESFTVRKLVKETNIPRSTIHKYLTELKKEGLVTKENKSSENLMFKIRKTNYFTEKIAESGLIDELIQKLNPSCIIVFGSIRKGESNKESDIDIFIESSINKNIEIKKYEKKLKHKIQLFIETNINSLQPNLFNNVINGVKLYGSFKIR